MKTFKVPINITMNDRGNIKKFAVEFICMGETRKEAYDKLNENLKIKFDIYETSMCEV